MKKITCKIYTPEEKMPSLKDDDAGFLISRPCIIKGKDGCTWMVYWDGEIWRHANYSNIMFNKDYVINWMYVPRIA
jgi:hypothetical protein